MAQFELSVELDFAAAHQIPGHPGKCARMHGHNYRVVVQVAGDELNELGMLVDFGDVRKVCQGVIGELDHRTLNELPAFASVPPTSEHIARHIYRAIGEAMAGGRGQAPAQRGESRSFAPLREAQDENRRSVRVSAVTVYESPRSAVTYRG